MPSHYLTNIVIKCSRNATINKGLQSFPTFINEEAYVLLANRVGSTADEETRFRNTSFAVLHP